MELGLYTIGERGNDSRGVRGFIVDSPGGHPRDFSLPLGPMADGCGLWLQGVRVRCGERPMKVVQMTYRGYEYFIEKSDGKVHDVWDSAHDVQNGGHKGVKMGAGRGRTRDLPKSLVRIGGWCHRKGRQQCHEALRCKGLRASGQRG